MLCAYTTKQYIDHRFTDLVSRGNSTPPSGTPWVQGDSLQWKVEDLEDQLQLKISQLEKQRSKVLKETERNRHEIDQGMNSLHHRVTDLEQARRWRCGSVVCLPAMAKQSHGEYQRSGTTLHAIALAGAPNNNENRRRKKKGK
ncbi:UNVERIFIED_CONTAM: hypothetical protein FKN15_066433 [Acipenser sinensis]